MRRSALIGACLLASGCINPFNPRSDVELSQLVANNTGDEIIVRQTQLTGPTLPIQSWSTECVFVIHNKVGVNLHSVEIVYTDMSGNEVTAYKTVGGRKFRLDYRILGVTNNDQTANGEIGRLSVLDVYPVDKNVVDELKSAAYPADKFMFANICFRGEDDNGYDVKLCGSIAIKYIP